MLACCILKWVTDGITDDTCLMPFRTFSQVIGRFLWLIFDQFLGIIPSTPGVIEENCQELAGFAVAALHEIEGIGLVNALQIVQELHPEALPHKAIWESLCSYYHEDIPYFDALTGQSK
jgi:hypothetical protein